MTNKELTDKIYTLESEKTRLKIQLEDAKKEIDYLKRKLSENEQDSKDLDTIRNILLKNFNNSPVYFV